MNNLVSVLLASRRAANDFAAEVTQSLGSLLMARSPHLVDPQHSIVWRIKSEAAICRKLERREQSSMVNDFIGIRVLVLHIGALSLAELIFDQWEKEVGLQLSNRDDYFSENNPNGYRAIHRDYVFQSPERLGLPDTAGVEVQLTTWLQHMHSTLSHSLYYKNDGREQQQTTLLNLSALSERLHELDSAISMTYWHKTSNQTSGGES
jgi:ppGpp synthetase/RelA/SpoT-type nucleotidyltranferase